MAQATFSCPYGAIHLENRWGTASVSTYAQRVLTGAFPPDPLFYGGTLLWDWQFHPAGKI